MAVTTPNLWALMSSNAIEWYFTHYILGEISEFQRIFLYNNYDNRGNRYNISVSNFIVRPTGLVIELNIYDSITRTYVFPMNTLHITIHSMPGGLSQTHIVTNRYPAAQINLMFSSDNPPYSDISCWVLRSAELNRFLRINRVDHIQDMYDIMEYVLPIGLQNIINAVKNNIGGALDGTDLMRTQSVQQKYINYKEKYLKYKQKYLELKKELTNKK
jgi:hypothetical protein